jgi:hypothetical protein
MRRFTVAEKLKAVRLHVEEEFSFTGLPGTERQQEQSRSVAASVSARW